MAFDEKKNAKNNLLHAGEFNKIENTAIIYVLRGWFGALMRPEDATEIVQASDDAWANTTLFEHFTSKLNEDPATRTPTNVAIYDELESRASAAQDRLSKLLSDTDEDERINLLTNRIVDEIIQKFHL